MFAHSCTKFVVPLLIAAWPAAGRSAPLPAKPADVLQAPTVLPLSAAAFVRGSVVDDATGAPVQDARVSIRGTRYSALTTRDGRFQFEDVPGGEYELYVAHIAYVAVPAVLHVGNEALDVVIRLGPYAIPLEPIKVTAFSRRLEDVGFYERQRRGIGTFLGRNQIDGMRATTSLDLLRNVPAARLTQQYPLRSQSGSTIAGRGRCRFSYIVDGARTLPDFEMDLVAPYAIEGLEYYRSIAELPSTFRAYVGRDVNTTSCGIVVIWTRFRT
jgi:hypothetical protein